MDDGWRPATLLVMPALITALAILLSSHLSGAPPIPQNQRTARQIAQAFDAHYHKVRTLAGYFLEKYTSGGSGLLVESGTVYFEKPGRMRWDYDSPEKKLFLDDGKDIWFYVPADHTASRTPAKQSTDWRTPLALLAGKVDLERLCGSLSLGQTSTAEAGDSVLICKPRKADENVFSQVLLELNFQSQLVRLDIQQPGDLEMDFHFGDWHEDAPIEAAKFHFEPPRGVAIVDDAELAKQAQ